MKGVMGSLSFDTSSCIRWSLIMKLVAEVSSSTSSTWAPTSIASIMLAAWEVLPLASSVENALVSWPSGRLAMNGEMSTPSMRRPSSALIFIEHGLVTTNSLPSPGIWLYTPSSSARRRVDLPWYPPPAMSITPLAIPIPVTIPRLGSSTFTRSDCGDSKGTTRPFLKGRGSIPLARGRIAPSATKATRPRPSS